MKYCDAKKLSEDQQITLIGEATMKQMNRTGFIVDNEATGDRYFEKLRKQWPEIILNYKGPMGGGGSWLFSVSPPLKRN